MKLKIVHQVLQQLQPLLTDCQRLMEYHSHQSYALEKELLGCIDNSAAFFENQNKLVTQSEIKQCTTEYLLAKRGTNPLTYEDVGQQKRKVLRTTAYRIINKLHQSLGNEWNTLNQSIEEGRELIGKIILSALQLKVVTEDILRSITSDKEVKRIWKDIAQVEQFSLLEKQLKLKLSTTDIEIIFHQLSKQITS